MEKISIFIYNAIMAYGTFGIVLGATIVALFIVQIALYVGLYGRVASFRLTSRRKVREVEPPVSIIVPIFSDDTEYLDGNLMKLLGQQYKEFEVVAVYVGNNEDYHDSDHCHSDLHYKSSHTKHLESRDESYYT